MKSPIVSTPGVLRPTIYLAGPVLIEQLLNALVGLVDTWLTGHYVPGAPAMAAIGLMAYTMWLLQSIFASISIGATALLRDSRARGMRHSHGAPQIRRSSAEQSWQPRRWARFISSETSSSALFNLSGEAGDLAHRYLQYLVPVIPAMMVLHVGVACLRGAGDTVSGFIAMTCVNAVNVAVGATLVTGAGGLPRLGWEGLAIGTAAGHLVGAAIILGLLVGGRANLGLRLKLLKPNVELIRRLLRVGLPGGADIAAVLACHLWFVGIVNSLGELQSSAHMLTVRIESLAYLPGTAFQVAAATMAGQYLGAKDPNRAVRGTTVATILGLLTGLMAGLWFYFGANSLTAFFTGSYENPTATTACPLLRLAAIAAPAMVLTMVLSGALRGAGDTRWPLVITLVGMLGIRIPLTYWLFDPQHLISLAGVTVPTGLLGAWVATLVDLVVRSLLTLGRFVHGGWLHTRV